LINPSVIEFQETMKELKELPFDNEEAAENTSFFMLLQSHGVRIEKGPNEGSYVMFHESRIFSEQELLLTSIHEKELAEMIHGIVRDT
jgi:hypothetical protein